MTLISCAHYPTLRCPIITRQPFSNGQVNFSELANYPASLTTLNNTPDPEVSHLNISRRARAYYIYFPFINKFSLCHAAGQSRPQTFILFSSGGGWSGDWRAAGFLGSLFLIHHATPRSFAKFCASPSRNFHWWLVQIRRFWPFPGLIPKNSQQTFVWHENGLCFVLYIIISKYCRCRYTNGTK